MKQFFILLTVIVVSCSSNLIAQQLKTLSLINKIDYSPKAFYIKSFKDVRTDTTIYKNGKDSYVIKGGLSNNLLSILRKSTVVDTAKTPIDIQIDSFTLLKRGAYTLEVSYKVLVKNNMVVHEMRTISKEGLPDASTALQTTNIFLWTNILSQIDKWILDNKSNLTPSVKVIPQIAKTFDDDDRIVYDIKRPLTLDDFKEKNKEKDYDNIDCEMRYLYKTSGTINALKVEYEIIPCFDKKSSWLVDKTKPGNRLLYNQGYFDIFAFKSCELKKLIESAIFTPDGYLKELQKLYDEVDESLDIVLEKYTTQTDYGNNENALLEYTSILTKQVKECNCY